MIKFTKSSKYDLPTYEAQTDAGLYEIQRESKAQGGDTWGVYLNDERVTTVGNLGAGKAWVTENATH